MTSRDDSSRDVSSLDEDEADALAEESLVAYHRGLDRRARADLERLARADARYGEDVARELAERSPGAGDGGAS